jgi:hypothetical protein
MFRPVVLADFMTGGNIQVSFARVIVRKMCREKFKKAFLGFCVSDKQCRETRGKSRKGSR